MHASDVDAVYSGETDLAGEMNLAGEMDLARAECACKAGAVCAVMEANGHRLYRLARGMVHDDGEAEDILQDAYLHAFTHLDAFRGESSLATWFTRIVINEALGRLRRRRRRSRTVVPFGSVDDIDSIQALANFGGEDPEQAMAQRQILRWVEQATSNLPETYRAVFIARIIDGLNVEQAAEALGILPVTVRTRLHRARTLVRRELDRRCAPGAARGANPSALH